MNENTITGYQWGNQNRFIGEYTIINNLDKDDIHLPPNTTLIPVPTGEAEHDWSFNEELQSWEPINRIDWSNPNIEPATGLGVQVVEPGVQVVEPGVQVVEPGVQVVEPGVQVVEPGVQ